MTDEQTSNKFHKTIAAKMASNSSPMPVDKAEELLCLCLLSGLSNPTFLIETVVELLCATHAAGQDINIYRQAIINLGRKSKS